MTRFNVLTLFPEMVKEVMSVSIIGRSQKKGIIDIKCYDIRDYSDNKHKKVDDTPYGGGKGMVMMAEPIARCYEDICKNSASKPLFIYMSPAGKKFTQDSAKDLAKHTNIALLCGHYEGVDERVLDKFVDERISIGDYVLTGGEIPAMVLIDAVCRMIPNVLSDAECFEKESYYNNLLEHPHYTKPALWRGVSVPDVLLSGNHSEIEKWRNENSIIQTLKYREDLMEK
jgi:tRNA (guanine-N1)-methyltransferase